MYKLTMYRFFSALFSVLLVWKILVMGGGLSIWFDWWLKGGKPNEVIGIVVNVNHYRDRGANEQTVEVQIGNELHILNAILDQNQIAEISSPERILKFAFYITSFGKKYIFEISDINSGKNIYKGIFHNSGWQGVIYALFLVFFILLLCFFSYCFFMTFKGETKCC